MDPDELVLIDMDVLLVELLSEALPGVHVTAASDAEDTNVYPLIVVTPGVGTPIPDSPTGYGAVYTTSIAMAAETRQKAFELANALHRELYRLADRSAAVEGVGSIGQVTDVFLPRRTGSARVGSSNVTEFLAVYSVEALTP